MRTPSPTRPRLLRSSTRQRLERWGRRTKACPHRNQDYGSKLALTTVWRCAAASVSGTSALLAAVACGSSAEEGGPVRGQHPDPDFSTQAVLLNLAERVSERYDAFDEAAQELETRAATYAESLDAEDRVAAQDAWRNAMQIWEQAELFRFGPAGDADAVLGGQGLGSEIYSWSLSTNPCRVDQETLEDAFRQPDTLAQEAINVRGLDALEYLLFNETVDNACAANLTINTSGSWQERSAELPQLRADYALALAVEVRTHAQTLSQLWDPADGEFHEQFVTAGSAGGVYPSAQAAIADVAGALLYIDTQTKSRKLGIPAGIVGCSTAICPESVESPFADAAKQNVINNLLGFQLIFTGNWTDEDPAFGLDDELLDLGATGTAEGMTDELQVAIEAAAAIEGESFLSALSTSLDSVQEAYDALQALTARMKDELVSELGVALTVPGAGDAD